MQPIAVLSLRDQSESDVRIQHHETLAALAADQLRQSRSHGLEHQPERPDVKGLNLEPELVGNHFCSQVGRGRSLNKELVFGEAFAVNVRHRDRGGFVTDAGELEVSSVGSKHAGKLSAENVVRDTP